LDSVGEAILVLLRRRYGAIDPSKFIAQYVSGVGLFEFIVAVMLSQNTSDVNAIKAYIELKKLLRGSITPEKILERSVEEIADAIRSAGMQVQRALRIRELAEKFVQPGFAEELTSYVERESVENARRKLMELPGVGAKTADVVLLMYFNKPTFPVDTHIMRVTSRMGFVERQRYEDVRRFWMTVLKPEQYLEAHLLLITHGRETCRARKPLCGECVVSKYCRYYSTRV